MESKKAKTISFLKRCSLFLVRQQIKKQMDWSKTYKERAKSLIAENKMHNAGLAAIKQSKASGLWNFMDDVDDLIIPKDLAVALHNAEGAFNFFNNINANTHEIVPTIDKDMPTISGFSKILSVINATNVVPIPTATKLLISKNTAEICARN